MATGGWSPSAASDTLATVDALIAALAQMGPEAETTLAPALAATAAVRAILTELAPEAAQEQSGPPRAGQAPAPEQRHAVPEFWIHRDMRVAEQLRWEAQEGRGGAPAYDAQGDVRPVLATAPRRTQVPQAATAEERACQEVDWLGQLISITGWTQPPRRPNVDWAPIEASLGTRLPGDYKRMVETFGDGAFDAYLTLNQEPWTSLREDGLLIWASTEHKNLYCWRTNDPDRWPVTVQTFDGEIVPFDCSTAEFVCRILLDPRHPFTMAHYFDTHWFMNYSENK
ncbi:SMI1/KNR4 family protein [Streptomyces sp. NPDC002012]|uniref:SMI1/KNR4 family protein n=1 Tax=Streptomyces sp. NPDC002012 TaxID=3154532 RepID=UPI00332C6D7A